MKNILWCLVLIGMSINTCSQNSEKKCNLLLKKANNDLCRFYLSNDTALLFIAKSCLDSIDCKSFKYKIFNIKTTLFILLKEYSEGIEYIKSLNTADFNRAYQKTMYLKSFKAMQSESTGDTTVSNKLYTEIVTEIQNYLDKNPDQQVLVDLFYIKSKIEKREKIIQEIDHLKKGGKYDNDFLNAIIETLKDTNSRDKSVLVPLSE